MSNYNNKNDITPGKRLLVSLLSGLSALFAGLTIASSWLYIIPLAIVIIISILLSKKPKVSNADELAKYKRLLDDGAITQEEYNAKKRMLL